ncbi:Hemolymph lipopolysaccharide-binding protein [Gryllus bimaculatus]|nr:Hemolymph lipopolysaccharide-binding protein [Gryllus bimaculatus]
MTGEGGRSAYKLFTSGLSWPAAQKRCQQDGAHLIVLDSQPEAQVVRDFFARNLTLQNATSTAYYHAGVYKRGKDFIDVLGEPVPEWARKTLDASSTEYCGRVVANGNYDEGHCELPRAFICEHE